MQEAVAGFFSRVIGLRQEQKLKPVERVVHLLFTIHAFQSLESEHVRSQVRAHSTWHLRQQQLAPELGTCCSSGRVLKTCRHECRARTPQMLPMVGLGLWHALSPGRLALELHAQPELAQSWLKRAKKVRLQSRNVAGGRSCCGCWADGWCTPCVIGFLLGRCSLMDLRPHRRLRRRRGNLALCR